jgi:LacI family transcriptional regulator
VLAIRLAKGEQASVAGDISIERSSNGPVRRVTMTDIARAAGCSQATVSVVLNNAPGVKISSTTRARVIEAARDQGYAAPTFAHLPVQLTPATSRSGAIGFMVDQLSTSPEAVVAIEGVRQTTWEDGRVVLIAQTMNDAVMEEKVFQSMIAHGIDALIYMTIFTRRITLPSFIHDTQLPVVLLNCYTDAQERASVIPAETEGGFSATQHLIQNGHRRIAMITGEPWMEAARDRLKGYRRALIEAGIAFDPHIVLQGNWSPSAGYECTRKLLSLKHRPTAIFCQNDRMAIGCYEALKEAGLHIPEDMSVIGYDDEEISRHLVPQLTTVVLPHRQMGSWAAEQLGLYKNGTHPAPAQKHMECTVTGRASVASISQISTANPA